VLVVVTLLLEAAGLRRHGPVTPAAVPVTPAAVPVTPAAVPVTPAAVPVTPAAVPVTPAAVPAGAVASWPAAPAWQGSWPPAMPYAGPGPAAGSWPPVASAPPAVETERPLRRVGGAVVDLAEAVIGVLR